MYRVMLVDDDYIARDGLKDSIDWASLGCEICGEVSDGERAYSMLNILKPDIIITDLQMPYMDGLTFSRMVRRENPDIGIIMVTSGKSFEYAKEAMRIGISDYLLKPVDTGELQDDIRMLTGKLNNRKRNIEGNCSGRDMLFDELVSSVRTPAEMIDAAREFGINLTSLWYNVILIDIVSEGHSMEDLQNALEAIDYELSEIAVNGEFLFFNRGLTGKRLLFKADSIDELKEKQREYLEQIKNILYKYEYIKFCGGVGEPVDRLGELRVSYEKACRAFAHGYILMDNLIIESSELEYGRLYMSGNSYGIGNIAYNRTNRDKLYKFLKFGDLKDVEGFVDNICAELGEEALDSGMVRNYIVADIYMSVCDFLEGFKLDRSDIEPPDITYEILQNRENSRMYLINILEKAMAARETTAKGRYNEIVDEIMRYIDENYSDDKLSLNQLAEHVSFSPNHLSMIFSQQTGRTFIKYLTEYRMTKAKELLWYTGKRSSEISVEVGYKDPHYFSYLFKKTQGMTPTAYRNLKYEQDNYAQ